MSSNHSSTLAIRDRPKPHLTNFPTEIRLILYNILIEDHTINVFRETPSEGDNLKDDTIGNLSLAYPALKPEIADWLESPHLRRSLRYGHFNPETTIFVFDLNSPLPRGYSSVRQLLSDFCKEEFLPKNVRRVRIEFDDHNRFHDFLWELKGLLQKLENIEFCDIEWGNSIDDAAYENIVGYFWFGVRDLMRRCPRKVRCSCCIADPEIRLRERDGAWKVLQPPKSDHSGWELWEIDDAEENRCIFELTRAFDLFNHKM
jgi:hypothetical protein